MYFIYKTIKNSQNHIIISLGETTTKIRDGLITGAIGLLFGGAFLNPVLGVVGENLRYFIYPDPVAKASIADPTDGRIMEGDRFTLTAAGSYDPDPWGSNLEYTWRQINSNGIYASPKGDQVREEPEIDFTAPANLVNDVVLTFELTVADDERSKKTDIVEVPVRSKHPLVRQWGEFNYFNSPVGIAVENIYGAVFVVDRNNNQIQKFDNDGDFITKWGSVCILEFEDELPGKCNKDAKRVSETGNIENVINAGDGQFFDPIGIAVDKDGNVYVVDKKNSRIQKFDANGNFLLKWNGKMDGNNVARNNTRDGNFDPTYIAVDSVTQNVYVTDERYRRIDEFDPKGTFIRDWTLLTDDTSILSFKNPTGIATSPLDPYAIYVADAVSNRINMFAQKSN